MTDISIIQSESRYLLCVGSEKVEVSDYKIQSSADGETELCVTIKGVSKELELKASLADQRQRFIPLINTSCKCDACLNFHKEKEYTGSYYIAPTTQ